MPLPQLEQAARDLQTILSRVAPGVNDATVVQILQELSEFNKSLPFLPEFDFLHEVANDSINDLTRNLTDTIIARIQGRNTELTEHVKTIVAVTDRLNSDAAQLRLDLAKSIAAAAVSVSDAVTAVQTAVKAGDLPSAASKVDEAMAAVVKFLNQLHQAA